jgi:hypothetical protein
MKRVLLLLADGFETFEASVFIDVIGWNLVDGDHSTELFTCGLMHWLFPEDLRNIIFIKMLTMNGF